MDSGSAIMALRGFRLLVNPTNLRKTRRLSTATRPLEERVLLKMSQTGDGPPSSPDPPGQAPTGQEPPGQPSALSHFSWLSDVVPVFGINGNQVRILQEPADFYQTLKRSARNAKKRIVLASLYLGTGELEKELVSSIRDAARDARARGEVLEVRVLLDYTRGSRGEENSRTLLLPLLREFPDSVRVSLFHTPELRGATKAVLPQRWNEIIGLHHLKIYMFDDNLIMSGANLSDTYFTNRQDRYILLEDCRQVASWFRRLVSTVSSLSFSLQEDDSVSLPPDLPHHPYNDWDRGAGFKREGKRRIEELIEPNQYRSIINSSNNQSGDSNSVDSDSVISDSASRTDSPAHPVIDTWICPMVQMGVFDVTVDGHVTESLMRRAGPGSHIKLASGYFNLTDHYMDTIINKSQATFDILSAHPEANGFYGAGGVSGAIPDAYTYISRGFWGAVRGAGQQGRVSLHEFARTGWTFHGKGLWYYLPYTTLPALTFIGSPNFGYRSVFRDLEAQVAIITDNRNLRQKLEEEQSSLYSRSTRVTDSTFEREDRRIPYWVTLVTPIIKNFF